MPFPRHSDLGPPSRIIWVKPPTMHMLLLREAWTWETESKLGLVPVLITTVLRFSIIQGQKGAFLFTQRFAKALIPFPDNFYNRKATLFSFLASLVLTNEPNQYLPLEWEERLNRQLPYLAQDRYPGQTSQLAQEQVQWQNRLKIKLFYALSNSDNTYNWVLALPADHHNHFNSHGLTVSHGNARLEPVSSKPKFSSALNYKTLLTIDSFHIYLPKDSLCFF